jgi:hypothetical protein
MIAIILIDHVGCPENSMGIYDIDKIKPSGDNAAETEFYNKLIKALEKPSNHLYFGDRYYDNELTEDNAEDYYNFSITHFLGAGDLDMEKGPYQVDRMLEIKDE